MEGTHSQPLISPQLTSEVHGAAQDDSSSAQQVGQHSQDLRHTANSPSGETIPSFEHLWAGKNSGTLQIYPDVSTGTRYPQKVSIRTQAVSNPHLIITGTIGASLCCYALACFCSGPQISCQCQLQLRFLHKLATLSQVVLTCFRDSLSSFSFLFPSFLFFLPSTSLPFSFSLPSLLPLPLISIHSLISSITFLHLYHSFMVSCLTGWPGHTL